MHNRKQSEEGFVAIVVTMMIMIILSLITIGFTRIMQREQRQALDRQLSKQALYAAESGVNDVYNIIKNNPTLTEKTSCDVTSMGLGGGGVLNTEATVAYTCAMYDKTPRELVYSLSVDDSRIAMLKTTNGKNFSKMSISWGNEDASSPKANDTAQLPNCGTDASVFSDSRFGTIPYLRLDVTDISTLNRDSLISGTDSLYIIPCKPASGGSATYAYKLDDPKGKIVQVMCDGVNENRPCVLDLTALNKNTYSKNTYSMRLRSVYGNAATVITATDADGNEVEFAQAQTSIDVTAKASDVTRRLRVSIPIAEVESTPEATFQAFNGACKLISVINETDNTKDRVNEYSCT